MVRRGIDTGWGRSPLGSIASDPTANEGCFAILRQPVGACGPSSLPDGDCSPLATPQRRLATHLPLAEAVGRWDLGVYGDRPPPRE
jgi:hypothetical protein